MHYYKHGHFFKLFSHSLLTQEKRPPKWEHFVTGTEIRLEEKLDLVVNRLDWVQVDLSALT